MKWDTILTEAAERIKTVVKQLMATSNAEKTYGIGAGGDPKKHIDLEAEKALVETLNEHSVNFTLISEESGVQHYGSKPTCYVTADPIDGTTNILRGLPFACTSIAISRTRRLDSIQAAAVADLFHDTLYLAEKERGAFRNDQKINPSKTSKLSEAVIGVDLNTCKIANLTVKLNQLLAKTKHIRHLGANALELCYVADGTTDAFIDIRGKLRTTDIAAATLIMLEAGAIVTTPDNNTLRNTLSPRERASFIAAGNKELHKIILEDLQQA
jgi:myo-inositol-1(or 4)-monophosphatase